MAAVLQVICSNRTNVDGGARENFYGSFLPRRKGRKSNFAQSGPVERPRTLSRLIAHSLQTNFTYGIKLGAVCVLYYTPPHTHTMQWQVNACYSVLRRRRRRSFADRKASPRDDITTARVCVRLEYLYILLFRKPFRAVKHVVD